MNALPVVCVDAVDVHGREGLLAAARAFDELGCGAAFVATAVLLGAGRAGPAVHPVAPEVLSAELAEAVARGTPPAVRTGILGPANRVEEVARFLDGLEGARVVVAPVTRAGGAEVMDEAAVAATRRDLFPRARVVVLRAGDVGRWTGIEPREVADLARAAAAVRELGAAAALVTGFAEAGRVADLLDDGGRVRFLDTTRVAAPRIAGLSTAHSAALAARLAAGDDLESAAGTAQRYVGSRLRRGA